MLRKSLILFVAATMGGLFMVVTSVLPATTASATQASAPSSCAGVIRITHLAFKPSAVRPGGSSTAYLTAVNCTNETQDASATWLGKFTRGLGGGTAGCPEIDPFSQPADFSPGGTFKSHTGYTDPGGCYARELQITVKISEGATVLAEKTTHLTFLIP
jgi:hypothetical protein